MEEKCFSAPAAQILRWIRARWLVIAAVMLLQACGGGGGGGGDDPPTGRSVALAAYAPLQVGDRLTFDAGGSVFEFQNVIGRRQIGSDNAFVVRSTSAEGTFDDYLVRDSRGLVLLPGPEDTSTYRLLGPLVLMRDPITVGDHWVLADRALPASIDYDKDGKYDAESVRIEAEVISIAPLTTAAGSFDDVVLLRTIVTQRVTLSASGTEVPVVMTSNEWYAPGVGLVRSTFTTKTAGQVVESTSQTTVAWKSGDRRSETLAPTITARSPVADSAATSAVFSVDFSEPIDAVASAAAALTVTGPDGSVLPGRSTWVSETRLTFEPAAALPIGLLQVKVTGTVEDRAGNPMAADAGSRFTVLESVPPSLVSVTPADGAVGVAADVAVRVVFDEEIDPASVTAVALMDESSVAVAGVTRSVAGRTLTLTPAAALGRNKLFRVVIAGVRDLAGNAMALPALYTSFRVDSGRFGDPVTVTTAQVMWPNWVIDDVLATGRPQFVGLSNATDLSVGLIPVQPDGVFGTPTLLPSSCRPGAIQRAIAVGQFDNTARKDVVLVTPGCGIDLISQADDGTWRIAQELNEPNATEVQTLRVAADARDAVLAVLWNELVLFRQTAAGVFTRQSILASWSTHTTLVHDVDGDGLADVVVHATSFTDTASRGLYWIRQRSDGSFDAPKAMVVPLELNGVLSLGDVDRDGRSDVAYVDGLTGKLVVRSQAADGSFVERQTLSMPGFVDKGVVLADLNRDGYVDLVVKTTTSPAFTVYWGNATGMYTTPVSYGRESEIGSAFVLAVVDVDGDGWLDVFVNGSVLLQRPLLPVDTQRATDRRQAQSLPAASDASTPRGRPTLLRALRRGLPGVVVRS